MRFIITVAVLLVYQGCSLTNFQKSRETKKRVFSCEEEAKPKSLQYIEQQYRCTSKGVESVSN